MTDALRQSHADEKQFHDEAIARLQAEYTRLQGRIDAMYVDKLDGRIDAAFFDRKAARVAGRAGPGPAGHRGTPDREPELHGAGRPAPRTRPPGAQLFEQQAPREKRRLLNFVLSNCTWKDGALRATFRQPFDLIAASASAPDGLKAAGVTTDGPFGELAPRAGLEPATSWLQGPPRFRGAWTISSPWAPAIGCGGRR